MLGFFNTETLSREDVIYAVITGAPLHQPLKRVSTNPHCCPSAEMFWPKKMFILLFLRVSCRQAPSFPTSPAGCPEKNQKELVERGGLHHGLTQSMATAPVEERAHCKWHSPAPPGREHGVWGKDKRRLNTCSSPGRTDQPKIFPGSSCKSVPGPCPLQGTWEKPSPRGELSTAGQSK